MIPNLLAPFVGRAEELVALGDAYDAACAGQFVPVLITGEAGVGKTRLVTEFVATLPAETPVHWGRCIEDGGAAPFWPWTQMLRSMTGSTKGVASTIGGDRFAGFAKAAWILRDHADRPTVLVVDDLHVADIGSLELMRFLVRAVPDAPVLLVGTHRVHELRADSERDVILGDVARFGRRLTPPRLDRCEVGALLAGIAGETVAQSVVDAVLNRTAGNALFVDETARVLVSTGFQSVDVIPDGVRAAVRARLRGVTPACREALDAAAVLGSQSEWSVLAVLLGVSTLELADRLEPAIALGMVTISSEGRLVFSHGLVRDAIHDELSARERAAWHQRAAQALLTMHAGRVDAHAAAIAQHHADALPVGGSEAAAAWASRAASVARAVYAHEQAAAWSDRAAALFAALGRTGEQAEELARAADDLTAVGHNDASSERARQVTVLARLAGSGELLARAALCRAAVFGPVRDQEAPALLREALDHPDNAAPSRRRAELFASMARNLGLPALDGTCPNTVVAREARAELEALVDGGVAARDLVLDALLSSEAGAEFFAERPAWLEEYTQLGPTASDPLGWRIKRTYWAASLALENGRLTALRRELDDWAHLAEVFGVRYWDWRLAVARASEALARGRLAEAEERAMAAVALAGDSYPELTVRIVVSIVITVRYEQGRISELTERWPVRGWGAAAILYHIEQGDTAAVAPLVAAYRAEAARPDRGIYWLCLMTYVTHGAVFIRDRETCRWVVDQLTPFADQFVMFGRCSLFGGPVAELVGSAAAVAGDPELAEHHLRNALRWAEEEDAPGCANRARLALAGVLADEGPEQEAERESLLRQVVRTGSRLGMAGLVARAELLLDGSAAGLELDRAAVELPPVGPVVRTFGAFSVTPAGADEPVRWSSKKARDTLKLLVTRRGATVAREELIELLWSGVDVARGRNRLSVVLTMVRSALDPDRRWPADHFVRADRHTVSLRTTRLDIDLDRFLKLAAIGLQKVASGERQGVAILDEALELASGGFLVEDVYADWPAAARAEVASTYAAVLRALADHAEDAGDRDAMVLRLSQIADRDPYDDQAHIALVGVLTAAGRHADAKRQQEVHAARLRNLDLTEPV